MRRSPCDMYVDHCIKTYHCVMWICTLIFSISVSSVNSFKIKIIRCNIAVYCFIIWVTNPVYIMRLFSFNRIIISYMCSTCFRWTSTIKSITRVIRGGWIVLFYDKVSLEMRGTKIATNLLIFIQTYHSRLNRIAKARIISIKCIWDNTLFFFYLFSL